MKQLRNAFSGIDGLHEGHLKLLIQTGETPDIVLAALLKIFDGYDGIVDCHWLYDFAGEAFDSVFELVAEASGEDKDEVKAMLYRAVIQQASVNIAEIYRDREDEVPDFSQRESALDWPVVDLSPSSGATSSSFEYLPFSALKLFGYTVGKTKGWPQEKRRRFLSDFMERELPPVVQKLFGGEYGSPMSSTRLRKVANLLASNCSSSFKRNAKGYKKAIEDWENDLKFLRVTFYDGHGLKFHPWPETRD